MENPRLSERNKKVKKPKVNTLNEINSLCLDCVMFCKQTRFQKIITCPNRKLKEIKEKKEEKGEQKGIKQC